MGELKIPNALVEFLRCPGRPDLPLRRDSNRMVCDAAEGALTFPIINGTPILINEANSVFSFADYEAGRVTTMDLRDESVRVATPLQKLKRTLAGLVPSKSRSTNDFPAELALREILAETSTARVLVVGAGDDRYQVGAGSNVVYSDVALAPDTQLIADAHDLPFAAGTFDAVFAIAVLEHVADPYRCVTEFQRVLRPGGLIYAVTPFLQQVHMGRYDFTRFTALGHRRLFRWFDEIRSGVANGPGMVVTWGIEYFLTSFSESHGVRSALADIGRFIGWPFLLCDGILAKKAGAYDCASGYYFFGRLRESPVHDRDIVSAYKGLNGLRVTGRSLS